MNMIEKRDTLLAKLAKANTLEEAQDKIIKKYSKKLNIKYKPYNDFVEDLDFYKGIRIGKLTTEITDFESIY